MRNRDINKVLEDFFKSNDEKDIFPIKSKEELLLFLKDWESEVLDTYWSPYDYTLLSKHQIEIEVLWKHKEEIFGKDTIAFMGGNGLLEEQNIENLFNSFYDDILHSRINLEYTQQKVRSIFKEVPIIIVFRLSKLLQIHFEETVNKFLSNSSTRPTVVAIA